MGNSPSSPSPPTDAASKKSLNTSIQSCPIDHKNVGKMNSNEPLSESKCPVEHKNIPSNQSGCPIDHTKFSKPSDAKDVKKVSEEGGCPIKHDKNSSYKNPHVYNVYGQRIDPTNNMPQTANQQPAANQSFPLDTERVTSNIPKAGTDSTWVYPSPQMVRIFKSFTLMILIFSLVLECLSS